MTTTTSRLRAFTKDDYPAWVAGSNLCYPDDPWSVEEVRHEDDKWDHSRFFKPRDHIKTWNDQHNRPMLAINEAMGFAKQPAWIGLELRLRP